MNNQSSLPILTVNKFFMAELVKGSKAPCLALGVIEERGKEVGFLAMKPDRLIPPSITAKGFNFGHSLIGTSKFVTVQFAFEFYGFGRYDALVNPNNPVVQRVLSMMVEGGNYFFLAINPDNSVVTFRSELGETDLAGLTTNFPKIQNATTTKEEYQEALAAFKEYHLEPSVVIMDWVCKNNIEYLDLSVNRFELTPS